MAKNQKLEIANCDLKKIDSIKIESLIRIIRGQQVMLDADLAMLYGVETKRLNEQVKRNINRFPEDFMFQLTQEESVNLRLQIVTSNEELNSLRSQFATLNKNDKSSRLQIATSKNGRGQHKKYLPYAFTRNGIAMLSSVLRSETAVGVNIRIMRAFTMIPHLVNYSTQLVQRIFNIEQHQQETDEKIDVIIEKIEEISPKPLPEQVFPTGCVWDAWAYVSDLVRSARQRIVIIDNFVDDRVLSMLTKRSVGVSATIHTRYNAQFLTDLKKHNTQYPEIEFIQLPQRNHDRFLIIDDKVYLLGASLKDIGTGLCAVAEMEIAPEVILELLKH
ncbi:MAG: ORF6N domain-containing protein [Bacteroidales bacterium]|nr:ORF6N domain-containing protein [Bacteroidales bacterium]MBR0305139.1 ORF6N domain-containing protein [Bacteroidales bacterium]